jgi:hypothetical protein
VPPLVDAQPLKLARSKIAGSLFKSFRFCNLTPSILRLGAARDVPVFSGDKTQRDKRVLKIRPVHVFGLPSVEQHGQQRQNAGDRGHPIN